MAIIPKGGGPPPHVSTQPRSFIDAEKTLRPKQAASTIPLDVFERVSNNALFRVRAGAAVASALNGQIDLNHPPPGTNIPGTVWEHLPPDDREAIWQQHLGSATTTGTVTPGTVAPPVKPTNPALAEFLERHPEIVTHQDFLMSFATEGVIDWQAFNGACADLGIDSNDILNYRRASIRDLAYPPLLHDGLPATAEDARRFHIVQVLDEIYNEFGPTSSKNCGPASLAMVLDTLGLIPPGLSAEQTVDYTRALMMGHGEEHTLDNGQTILLLDDDTSLTSLPEIAHGAQAAGLMNVQEQSGWDELNTALENGHPVVAFGDLYPEWIEQFDDFEGVHKGGGIPHFIAILGRTADGKYIVSDPLFTGGPVEMTQDQLSVFFNKGVDDPPYNEPRFVGEASEPGAGSTETAPEADNAFPPYKMD